MPLKINKRHGFGMIGIFVAILATALLMVSVTRLLKSISMGLDGLSERLEMQSIIQDQWKQLNVGTYEEFEALVTAKGPTWTESFGTKYDMKVEFGENGKYVDAVCNASASVSDLDRQCRKVIITIVSKSSPDIMESLQMTRVSEPDEKELLKKIENKIAANSNQFSTLYTKTESDTRYIRYGTAGFACPTDYKKNADGTGCEACDAPANDMQYRSGNCQLSTCPSGQMANEAQDGCITRVCNAGTKLNAAGTSCESCSGISNESRWKQYYGANCVIQTCPVGQQVNDNEDGCEAITCPEGKILKGDECVTKCNIANLPHSTMYTSYYFDENCRVNRCPTGQRTNADATGCENVVCSSGEVQLGTRCCPASCPVGQIINSQGCNCIEKPTKICEGNGSYYSIQGYNRAAEKVNTIERIRGRDVVYSSAFPDLYTVLQLPSGTVHSLIGNGSFVVLNVPIAVHGLCANNTLTGQYSCWSSPDEPNITVPAGTPLCLGYVKGAHTYPPTIGSC